MTPVYFLEVSFPSDPTKTLMQRDTASPMDFTTSASPSRGLWTSTVDKLHDTCPMVVDTVAGDLLSPAHKQAVNNSVFQFGTTTTEENKTETVKEKEQVIREDKREVVKREEKLDRMDSGKDVRDHSMVMWPYLLGGYSISSEVVNSENVAMSSCCFPCF